jgi:hypothetical protein
MLLVMAIIAPIAACLLVLFALILVSRINSTLAAVRHQQAEEFAQLRRAIAELRKARPEDDQPTELPRIGASARVLQVGDQVAIIDGPHTGGQGTIAPSPEWLREGVACVDLIGQGQRYVEMAKLAPLDEAPRG